MQEHSVVFSFSPCILVTKILYKIINCIFWSSREILHMEHPQSLTSSPLYFVETLCSVHWVLADQILYLQQVFIVLLFRHKIKSTFLEARLIIINWLIKEMNYSTYPFHFFTIFGSKKEFAVSWLVDSHPAFIVCVCSKQVRRRKESLATATPRRSWKESLQWRVKWMKWKARH